MIPSIGATAYPDYVKTGNGSIITNSSFSIAVTIKMLAHL